MSLNELRIGYSVTHNIKQMWLLHFWSDAMKLSRNIFTLFPSDHETKLKKKGNKRWIAIQYSNKQAIIIKLSVLKPFLKLLKGSFKYFSFSLFGRKKFCDNLKCSAVSFEENSWNFFLDRTSLRESLSPNLQNLAWKPLYEWFLCWSCRDIECRRFSRAGILSLLDKPAPCSWYMSMHKPWMFGVPLQFSFSIYEILGWESLDIVWQ